MIIPPSVDDEDIHVRVVVHGVRVARAGRCSVGLGLDPVNRLPANLEDAEPIKGLSGLISPAKEVDSFNLDRLLVVSTSLVLADLEEVDFSAGRAEDEAGGVKGYSIIVVRIIRLLLWQLLPNIIYKRKRPQIAHIRPPIPDPPVNQQKPPDNRRRVVSSCSYLLVPKQHRPQNFSLKRLTVKHPHVIQAFSLLCYNIVLLLPTKDQ